MGIEAEIKRYWVEIIAQHVHIGEQHGTAACDIDPLLCQVAREMRFGTLQRIRVVDRQLQMLPVPETEKIEAVATEHGKAPGQQVYLIQVYIKHEDTVMEPVRLGRQPVVHHGAGIKAIGIPTI